MFHTFAEAEQHVLASKTAKRIALAGAHDDSSLSALVEARRRGIASGLLIGSGPKIRAILEQLGEPADDYEIIHEPDEKAAAALAVAKVKGGEADVPMKGLMQTASLARAILDKETGLLLPGRILSHCTVFSCPDRRRMMFVTDCAINISPGVGDKAKILRNAVKLAACFGIERPKVAVVSALEKVNEKIPSTAEAAEIVAMNWDGCDVGGPYALDVAVDARSARHKGVDDPVAGNADILLMPDLCAGNIFHKSLRCFAHLDTAGALCGAETPVVLTSRADSPRAKYHSILTAILQCRE